MFVILAVIFPFPRVIWISSPVLTCFVFLTISLSFVVILYPRCRISVGLRAFSFSFRMFACCCLFCILFSRIILNLYVMWVSFWFSWVILSIGFLKNGRSCMYCRVSLYLRIVWSINDFICVCLFVSWNSISSESGVISSAAAEGVGALLSATKSAIVKSISCPIPVIMGVLDFAMLCARVSELKHQRSSLLPPPRVMSIVSMFLRDWAIWRLLITDSSALGPWTIAGIIIILTIGYLLLSTFVMS